MTAVGSRATAGLLANASIYSAVQRMLGADGVRRQFVAEYLKPARGERILDLGCGPGDILSLLPEVEYVGVDLSPGYLEAARRRFGDRGRFVQADVRSLPVLDLRGFDAIVSVGLAHHLDDQAAAGLARTAAELLAPDGRLVTLDPAFSEAQSRVARWLIRRDRGRHVRTPERYAELAKAHFDSVRAWVHHDLARVPYTHAVLECREPREVSSSLP